MKALLRILLVVTVIVFFVYYTSDSIEESKPLEGPNATSKVIPKTEYDELQSNSVSRPTIGMSTWIGKKSSEFQKAFGKPTQHEPSAFGYEWWIYKKTSSKFMMVGVNEGIVTQVYIAGEDLQVDPFKIGQPLEEIYRSTILNPEVSVVLNKNIYTFALNDLDMRTRILVQFGDIYAQLYTDEEQQELRAIRFTDGKTLVLHKPYEMSFVGELLSPPTPSSYLQEKINSANEHILFDIVNLFREHYGLTKLKNHKQLSDLASMHSKDMMLKNYLSHDSPTYGSLKDRLEESGVLYKSAAENIASAYYDGIEAAHGSLNSEEHRSVMLDKKFSSVGSGVFLNYYTQILIENEDTNSVIDE